MGRTKKTRRKVTAALFCCLWTLPCPAQDPALGTIEKLLTPRVRRDQRNRNAVACPFETPRLLSNDPKEVAWAATRLSAEDCRDPRVIADVLTALRAAGAGETEGHRRAVLHLLHAAFVNGITIPVADLRAEPEGRARIPWIALQTRAATRDGREVFQLFHALDATTDPGWELVGGTLAIRGHGVFAIELRTQMTPRLRVTAGRRTRDESGPKVRLAAPEPMPDFPDAPSYCWERDTLGFVSAAAGAREDCAIDEGRLDRARLRWLAELGRECDPLAWAARFDATFLERDIGKFPAFAAAAEKRATESLAAVDLELRRRFKIPERVVLPGLEVVWLDGRDEKSRKARPMPVRQ